MNFLQSKNACLYVQVCAKIECLLLCSEIIETADKAAVNYEGVISFLQQFIVYNFAHAYIYNNKLSTTSFLYVFRFNNGVKINTICIFTCIRKKIFMSVSKIFSFILAFVYFFNFSQMKYSFFFLSIQVTVKISGT